jgi:molecular chaperone HtpG
MSKQPSLKAGMYLLETLTAGMYNEPMSIFREYIQNAVDSIDQVRTKRSQLRVDIELDPFSRAIRICDNGPGISVEKAEGTLSAIGLSEKTGTKMRGFRGIGRLGGIGFCDKAVYRTKAKGEKVESVQEWDCKAMRRMLSESAKSPLSLEKVFGKVTAFHQENGKRATDSYFAVTLEGVTSFRGYNLDIERVREYLGQVAPLPFDPRQFSFHKAVEDYLAENLNGYGSYEIYLNGNQLFKPYKDTVKVTKGGYDPIDEIKLFKIKMDDWPIAYGWYGQRKEMCGAISKGEGVSGIRVRVGDILLGDAHLLDGCFREPRFNGYVVGEIHVDCPDLIPNSRRDDFVDNDVKTAFYNEIEREVGLPISKEVRLRSRLNTKASKNAEEAGQCSGAGTSCKKTSPANPSSAEAGLMSQIPEDCRKCATVSKLLSWLKKAKAY